LSQERVNFIAGQFAQRQGSLAEELLSSVWKKLALWRLAPSPHAACSRR
jgi:hypothetical protein